MEEQRFGQTHPDVLALNPQLEAALESLAGVVAISGWCHCSLLHAVYFRLARDIVMTPWSYIIERPVDSRLQQPRKFTNTPESISPDRQGAANIHLHFPMKKCIICYTIIHSITSAEDVRRESAYCL